MARLALDARPAGARDLVTDLRAAALEHRGTAREPELRALLVELLAARAELPAAVREARAAARDLPARGGAASRRWRSPKPRRRDPEAVRAGRLCRDRARRRRPDRGRAGRRPGAARDRRPAGRARPAVAGAARRRPGAGLRRPRRRVWSAPGRRSRSAARAAARATLAGLNGPGSAALRAEAFALDGDYGRALALLDGRAAAARRRPTPGRPAPGRGCGATPRRRPGARWRWPASWPRRRRRRRRRPGGAAARSSRFREPLPDLARPSLDAARRLLAVGPKVGGLVAEALTRRLTAGAPRRRREAPCASGAGRL